ncbi:MAG: hypothetical protein KY469_04010 [Actinobacteria bacterium]|nr:hypothetical protein [Actinomycetota bacterium]
MRRSSIAALTAGLLVALAAPASAHPTVPLAPTLPTDLTHAKTDNLEYHGRFPEHTGNAGGRVLGDRYYVTDPRGVYVYDVSTPESPELLGFTPLFQHAAGLGATGIALAQEDPDTNGEILLVDGSPLPNGDTALQVVDVSDPAEGVAIIGTADVTDHTWTCVSGEVDGEVNSCAYAYGRTGYIVDLTDPTNPTLLPGRWRQHVGYGSTSNDPYAHDLTEVAPGLVIAAGASLVFMDTTDPAAPVLLNRIEQPGRWHTFGYHAVEWANEGRDPILVAGTEIPPTADERAGSECDEGPTKAAVIDTWDTTTFLAAYDAWKAGEEGATLEDVRAAEFALLDSFDAGSSGIFLDGEATGNVLYCAHWMELHPEFDGGGKMVVGYYNRGTRFVDIAPDGTMSEIAWIVGADGFTGSAQWVSGDVVYIHDYTRGMEVVELGEEPATGVHHAQGDAVAPSSVTLLAAEAGGGVPAASTIPASLGLLLLAVELWRRRRHAAAADLTV